MIVPSQWSRASAAAGVVVAVVGLGACSSSGVVTDTDSLVTNSDGASTVAGEVLRDSGGDYTHGILTIENATDNPVILRGVRLVDPDGDIQVAESYVVPEGRPDLYVSSDDSFPPDTGNGFFLEPLAGFELRPFPQGEGKQRNVEVLLHLVIGQGQQQAGYPSFCVQFSLGTTEVLRERCVDHAFFACPDPTLDACGPKND